MTDTDANPFQSADFDRRLQRRHATVRRLKFCGIAAIVIALALLGWLITSIVIKGYSAFYQAQIKLDIYFDPEVIDPSGERESSTLRGANYQKLIDQAINSLLPEVQQDAGQEALQSLVSGNASLLLASRVTETPGLIGQEEALWLPASSPVDQFLKGEFSRELPEDDRPLSDRQIALIDQLIAQDRLAQHFNGNFFTRTASRDPQTAGIGGAVVASFLMLLVTLAAAFPVAVAAAIYLEEFAPKNFWTELIEVNINNLAAVPSIIFGLLGLAVFINFFGMPRSSPLVGGLVLALMTLPTVIVSARAALRSVPASIRFGGLAVGVSQLQVVWFQVLPRAMPGILTGTIIGMAQALGETAPLLMIGMVAFVATVPTDFTDAAAPLPVQIYLWFSSPERGFVELTSAGILVLLVVLFVMNGLAIFLRQRLQHS